METFFEEVYDQLESDLRAVTPDRNAVRGYDIMAESAETCIKKIRDYLNDHPFPDKGSEILYFKRWAPLFFKLQILYTFLYNLERTRISASDAESFNRYIKKKERRVRQFLKQHKKLRLYHRLGETNRDNELFVSMDASKTKDFLTAEGYYCKNSIALAMIMAYEELVPVLTGELSVSPARTEALRWGAAINNKTYTLNLSKAQAAELIYALVKSESISVDGRPADIKDVTDLVKGVFNYEIRNIYDTEYNNRKKKKDPAPFLTVLRDAYLSPDNQIS